MPVVTAVREVDRSLADIWEFVQDFSNWAPLLRGYVKHEVQSETDSVWTLKGEAGPLSREVNLAVHITEYTPERVAFTLKGRDEAVEGGGAFIMEPSGEAPVARPRSWWQRFVDWLTGAKEPELARGSARVTFEFTIEAQGPMGPMINAMLGPWAGEVAEELLVSIGDALKVEAAA
jgi:hypothetical protein